MTNLETEPAQLPPPTPSASPPHDRRWARSDDRVVLGVAGGLGRALAIDPLLIRIAFVVLGLFSGVGILLYIAALLLLADSPTSPPPSTIRRIAGVVAVLLVCEAGCSAATPGFPTPVGSWPSACSGRRSRCGAAEHRADVCVGTACRGADRSATVAPPPTDGIRWTTKQPRPAAPAAVGTRTADNRRRHRGRRARVAASRECRQPWRVGVRLGNRRAGRGARGRSVRRSCPLADRSLRSQQRSPRSAHPALSFAGRRARPRLRRPQRVHRRREHDRRPVYRTGMGNFELIIADYPRDLSTAVEVGVGDLTVVVPDDAQVQIDARVGIGSIDALGILAQRLPARAAPRRPTRRHATDQAEAAGRCRQHRGSPRLVLRRSVRHRTVPTYRPMPARSSDVRVSAGVR